MIVNAGISAELAKGHVTVYDAVTLTVKRGRIIRFPGASGVGGVATPITDTIRWTSAPRALRIYGPDGSGPYLFAPLVGAAYTRSKLRQALGREVVQVGLSVAWKLPLSLATACDGAGVLSGAFATSLAELCDLGLLDGAAITIDQVVLPSGVFPSTPAEAGAAYGIVSIPPVRKFGGIVRQASPNTEVVELACCDPMILGGGSVPNSCFSPSCRWEFGDGRCPVAWNLQANGSGTHSAVAGSGVVFPTPQSVRIPGLLSSNLNWCVLVPQDGPMMGMRFQVGRWVESSSVAGYSLCEFADTLPWAWSCTTAHVEVQCSKTLARYGSAGFQRGCLDWDGDPVQAGMPSSINRFSGSPDMPQPESA